MEDSATNVLFEDIFAVTKYNPDGKKFDKVSRLLCKSETYDIDLIIDVNTEVYPMNEGDRFSFALASTVSLDGTPNTGVYDQSGDPSLLDRFEYAMHGKIFAYKHMKERGRVSVFASFGGLLMCIKGLQRNLVHLEMDQRIFSLIKLLN